LTYTGARVPVFLKLIFSGLRFENFEIFLTYFGAGLVLYELFERKIPMFDPNTQITTLPRQFQVCPPPSFSP
jgi:hypothetical protein